MDEFLKVFTEKFIALLLVTGLVFIVNRIAWNFGFYALPPNSRNTTPSGFTVAIAFIIFLAVQALLYPVVTLIFELWPLKSLDLTANDAAESWFNLIAMALVALLLIRFVLSLASQTRASILGAKFSLFSRTCLRDIKIGMMSWFLAYAGVLWVAQLVGIIFIFFNKGPAQDQAAVTYIKNMRDQPLLILLTGIAIVTVVPFIEELLFRGFLQSWLKTSFNRGISISLTSLVFAVFHFSSTQGYENLEYLSSLFLLSCYLGFLKEKEDSLIPSIALHSTFNLISLGLLFYT